MALLVIVLGAACSQVIGAQPLSVENLARGYQLHDMLPVSKKLPDVRLRRITVADPAQPAGNAFTIAPAFVLLYMTGYTDAVANALFLRGKFVEGCLQLLNLSVNQGLMFS
jgi:hypothetical protein